ncbi:hypothetical protein [Nocardiopsis lambiniae]|uniref:Uncharacterized protein n=1 Tax=Nocardiopsis lambiniae TaxID=3075539 RepID=A0ABU2MCG5_9ACTN|nr:hypothetical protein [Nocardiopsis sp. DSM 44743]MDT0330374.1 hypothetical protein [Nocardiopsis sp. DSM 44743]
MSTGPAQPLLSLIRRSWGDPTPVMNPFVAAGPGWVRALVLSACGALAIGGAVGSARAPRGRASARSTSVSVAVYGVCVLLSGVWVIDPMSVPPPGATGAAAPRADAAVRTALGWAAPIAPTRAILGGSGCMRSTGRGGLVPYSWASALVAVVGGVVALAVPTLAGAVAWTVTVVLWAWAWPSTPCALVQRDLAPGRHPIPVPPPRRRP